MITTITYSAVRDTELFQKCVAGDDAAWSQVVRDYQPRLEAYLERVLKIRGSLINEISTAIWSTLWYHRESLRWFNPARGRLLDYLAHVAIHEIDHYCRSQRSRAAYERSFAEEPATEDTEAAFRLGLEEILSSLPPRAREVTEAAVLARDGAVWRIPRPRGACGTCASDSTSAAASTSANHEMARP